MKKFSLVIPAYNEAKNLPQLLRQTLEQAIAFGFTEKTFSLVLVNNGSKDDSQEVIEQEIRDNSWGPWIHVVAVTENKGYGDGLFQGLKATQAEVIGWTHADLQCDPKNAFLAYDRYRLQKNSQTLVKGHRSGRLLPDRIVTATFELLSRWILGIQAQEINAQPKIFPRELCEHLLAPPSDFAFDLYVLYVAQQKSYNVVSLSVLFPPRIHGVSHWAAHFTGRYKTIWRMILYMNKLRRTSGRL